MQAVKVVWACIMCAATFPVPVRADYIDVAALRYHINPDLLRSIGYYESRLNPDAIHRNSNGSVDIGLMQINSIHLHALRARGIDRSRLVNASVNADVGASLLREKIDRYGNTWAAVGEYHSHTRKFGSEYARAIHEIYVRRPWCVRQPNM
ncbi:MULTISPECIES: lytic transglycosylase domain-containing protein [Burkholderia]|nr:MULTISPECIES: lytic transglycosylase domain-containing protein [Burkholderia]